LAQKKGQHVTVVVNTVVETVRQAAWLRQLGVPAAPALGRNRADHERKDGLANADAFDVRQVFDSQLPVDPTLQWMPTPCALSGSNTPAIPVGNEPCYDLIGEDGGIYRCPLIPVCPVHRVSYDLVSSQVWVVNSMSFLYSRAPEGIGEGNLYLFEAIYRL